MMFFMVQIVKPIETKLLFVMLAYTIKNIYVFIKKSK